MFTFLVFVEVSSRGLLVGTGDAFIKVNVLARSLGVVFGLVSDLMDDFEEFRFDLCAFRELRLLFLLGLLLYAAILFLFLLMTAVLFKSVCF